MWQRAAIFGTVALSISAVLAVGKDLAAQDKHGAVSLAAIRQQDLLVTTLETRPLHLNELLGDGKPLIVEFWATWCAPCRKLTPVYRELASKYASEGLLVVGLSVDEEADIGKVIDYRRDHRADYPMALAGPAVYRSFNPGREKVTVPRAFFFDRSGELVTQIHGLSLFGTEGKIKRAAARIVERVRQPKVRD